jgi:hypothetical protein
MSDIRRLLESLDKLAEQGQAAKKVYDFPSQQKLPIGTLTNIPAGNKAFNMMGQQLTKPVEPTQKPATGATTPAPGQKSLPLTLPPSIDPETPAYTPKQPWLDPKGAKEPAYMRKAAGTTPPQPLGVIGGTGPDTKFAKAAPVAANEPSIPKQSATVSTLTKPQPRVKVGAGSEYSNVYSTAAGGGNKPSFADQQYAKDVRRELEKTPDDPNLKAELNLLQQRGIATSSQPDTEPELAPQTQLATRPNEPSGPGRPGQLAAAPVAVAQQEPTYYKTPDGDWIERLHRITPGGIPGAIKEQATKKVAEEFEEFLSTNFPISSRKLKEQTKGPFKPTTIPLEFPPGGAGGAVVSGPRVTPGPVPRTPANVEVPAYQRAGQPSAMPQGAEVPAGPKPRLKVVNEPSQVAPGATTSANAPIIANPIRINPARTQAQARRRDQELMQTRPGDDQPIKPPTSTSRADEPLPPKMQGDKKMWSPAAVPVGASMTTGGGGKEGQGQGKVDQEPAAEPTSQTVPMPVEIWRPEDLPPVTKPADIAVEPEPVKPQPEPTKPQVKPQPEPVKPQATPQQKPASEPTFAPAASGKDKEKDSQQSSGSGGGTGGGVGTGTGPGVGSGSSKNDDWIERLHRITPGGIPGAVKEFKEFINDFKVPYDKRKIK